MSCFALANVAASCDLKNEPDVEVCVYIGEGKAHCFPTNPSKSERVRDIKVGDMLMDYRDYGKVADHHEDLHIEIEDAKKR